MKIEGGFPRHHRAPKGPCTQIVYTLAPKYLYRDYFKANVYTNWAHGPLGFFFHSNAFLLKEALERPSVDVESRTSPSRNSKTRVLTLLYIHPHK